ncbi:MAG: hypothetical protein A3J46_06085 [Candidatus Yanofskybacteria bacterium RIFCSPHIGHO2_02_FULL_41_11]|uniref:Uncharacterized protein n=1 Tax=Candidatus Yanofskybacteria bacterium RIFCSPHIGHO2_02_FULL_41_11 TaxID=1802675 RepID=A0A1F8F8Y2_9BACT|nr:MAG: hypothetical protein A3J46_06085 [Candidatus Yanofskybacteria bacterium RIFCSPHIGHO2_02_FULL_41_11]
MVAGVGFEPTTFRFWMLAAVTGSVGLYHHPAKLDAPIIVSERFLLCIKLRRTSLLIAPRLQETGGVSSADTFVSNIHRFARQIGTI